MNKPKSRQAILLIHGIGEQRPMSTLRNFVTALVGNGFRSKPDDLSKSFELRRLTYEVEKDDVIYLTCFFECYWAYRLRENHYALLVFASGQHDRFEIAHSRRPGRVRH